jgi:hypothetical protein
MAEMDIMQALKESYREVLTREGKRTSLAMLRRYLLYAADLLEIILKIRSDRRWRDFEY